MACLKSEGAIGVTKVNGYVLIPAWKGCRFCIASKAAGEENPHRVREGFDIAKPL